MKNKLYLETIKSGSKLPSLSLLIGKETDWSIFHVTLDFIQKKDLVSNINILGPFRSNTV